MVTYFIINKKEYFTIDEKQWTADQIITTADLEKPQQKQICMNFSGLFFNHNHNKLIPESSKLFCKRI